MSRSVLIVDDHAGSRRLARALLETEGFDVVGEAADGGLRASLAELAARSPVPVQLTAPGVPLPSTSTPARPLPAITGPRDRNISVHIALRAAHRGP